MEKSIPIDPNRKEVCNVTSSAGLNGQPRFACVALKCDCFHYILDDDLQTRGRAISGHRANAISWCPLWPDNRNARRTYGAVCIGRILDSPVGYSMSPVIFTPVDMLPRQVPSRPHRSHRMTVIGLAYYASPANHLLTNCACWLTYMKTGLVD